MPRHCLQVRSDQKVEYFSLSASSSTTTSKLLPAAERAETKLRRPKNRPRKKDRIVRCGCVMRQEAVNNTAAQHIRVSWSYVVRFAPALPSPPLDLAET
jgi:hypothetical protein